jgi:MoaA/NifB/PqqE/SkfB family radical SAM enzyme
MNPASTRISPDLDDESWFRAFRQKTTALRVPVAAMLEITSRCNLKCQHCYLGDQTEQHRKRASEMSTDEVKGVIDQLVQNGCLTLTITGGDPMMRKDFADIYRYAREQGLMVTVFCDGILVTEAIMELFRDLPPRKVEVSLYGATAATYETVTRVPGSFPRACAGIRRLIDGGVTVELKTVLMTLNRHELSQMAEWAKELGVSFRFDGAIFPCLPDGAREPLDLRVSPEVLVEEEMKNPRMREVWRKKHELASASTPSQEMYSCGAGASALYVDPFGNLSPCLMTTQHRHSLKDRPLSRIWGEEIRDFRLKKRCAGSDSALGGSLRGLCSHCPAFNALETGDENVDSPYAAQLAKLRLKHLAQSDVNAPQGTI